MALEIMEECPFAKSKAKAVPTHIGLYFNGLLLLAHCRKGKKLLNERQK
jgi:hypothetical protein